MVHDSFSSQSEGDQDFPQAFEMAEQFGTPPTRSRSTGGRRERFVAKDVAPNRGQKRDRHTQKTDRQKGRLDARYHKELDTTLQVLGIDGDVQKPLAPVRITTSVHAPLVDETPAAPRRTASVASSSVFFSPRAGLGRTPSEAGLSEFSLDPDNLGERQGIQDRKGSLPPRHLGALTPVSPSERQPSPRTSQGLRSLDHLEDGALHRLQSARQEWHADLDSLLEGNFASEDLDLAITLAKNKANDLKEQLTWWARPPEADWPTREQRLEWLEHALGEAQDIMRAMQSNGALDADLGTYVEIVQVVLKDLRGMACMIGEAVAEGLRSLEPAHHDTKRGFRAANKALHLVLDLTKMLRHISRLDPGAGLELDCTDLGACAQEIVLATLQATATLQDSLLYPGALSPGSVHSGHELQVKARMLQMCWDSCGKLIDFVAHFWPEKRGSLYCEWCKLFLKAATAAEKMQEALRQYSADNLGFDSLSIDETPCSGASGVWGSCNRANRSSKSSGTVSDEDLQAQAWLPSCLRALLAEAEKAADAVLSWETGEEYEGGPPSSASMEETHNSPKGTGAACIIVEALSESMYDLAHTGAQRVATLCREPSGLACWALELLEEQACMAVLFVRDLDRGILGRGSHGLQQYEMLRRGTDALVNGILRVRRLLKQKRTADGDDAPVGAPLQPVLPSNPSTSSLSSDVTSMSTASAAKQSASRASFSSLTRVASVPDPPLAAEQMAQDEVGRQPSTPATPMRKVEGSLSSALSATKMGQFAGQPKPSLVATTSDSVAPTVAVATSQKPPSLASSASSTAIAIPKSSALPAHSTWGNASKAPSAAPRPLLQPAQREAPGDSSTYRERLARFAAGSAQQPCPASPAGRDRYTQEGSTRDGSLKVESCDDSFHFVGRQGTSQLASSPEQLPHSEQPGKATNTVAMGKPDKPSPAAQHASFRRWASCLDNSHTAQADAAPEDDVAPAGDLLFGDKAVAAHLIDAMLQPHAPPAVPSGFPSAAAILGKPMPVLAPLPSPFNTDELQRTSVPLIATLQSAESPRDSAFLGFPKQSTAQPPVAASSNGVPAMPAAPSVSSSHARADHDRHPVKDRRHSKWKNFGRGGFNCPKETEAPDQEPPPENSPPSCHSRGRSSKGRFSRSSRGHREDEPTSSAQAAPEPMDRSASGQGERSASGKPGLFRRFRDGVKDALKRPSSGGSKMDRQESTMDRQESVLLTNGSGGALPEPVVQPVHLHMQERSHVPTSRSHGPPDSRHHGSSRHRGHFKPHGEARVLESDRGSEGRKRHRRRSRRHSSRGRPNIREHQDRRKTDGHHANASALVMPWEGDPFWQIKWEDIKPALVRKVGSGGFAQVYEVYMYGALMAVKIVNLKADQDLNLSEALVRFKDEVDLQRRLSLHPNVVRFMGACCHIPNTGRPFQDDTLDNWQGVTLAILMELCQYGTLYDVMNQARRIMHINQDIRTGRLPLNYLHNSELKSRPGYKLLCSWRLRLDLALQAAAALSYTHDHGVVHRDLTSTNLLVTNKWECKLSDFGLSRAIEGPHLPNSGQLNSLEWMPPERLLGENYGTAADVFSYGVVLWELLTLEQPWFNDHERPGLCSRVMPEIHGGNQLFVIRQVPLGMRLPLPSAQDVEPPLPDLPKVVSIVEDCWKDAAQRPTMKQIFDRLKIIVDGLKKQESGQRSALR